MAGACPVTVGAETVLPHDGEVETMLVVVTRGAQATAKLPRRRVAHEAAPTAWSRSGEALLAQCLSRGLVVVQGHECARGEVRADQALLVLGLVTAATLAVADGLREVRMAVGRVALPAPDALRRVQGHRVVRGHRRGVAQLAILDVGGGPRDGRVGIGAGR